MVLLSTRSEQKLEALSFLKEKICIFDLTYSSLCFFFLARFSKTPCMSADVTGLDESKDSCVQNAQQLVQLISLDGIIWVTNSSPYPSMLKPKETD